MDWLDKILDEYEKKEKERKAEKDEAKKKLAADLEIKRQQGTTALEKIHKSFSEVENKLKSRKYPCDSNINVYANAQTGKQHYSEAILIVRNNSSV